MNTPNAWASTLALLLDDETLLEGEEGIPLFSQAVTPAPKVREKHKPLHVSRVIDECDELETHCIEYVKGASIMPGDWS